MDDDGWDRVADCGYGVYVGSRWSCDNPPRWLPEVSRRIHIQYPGQGCACKNQEPDDLRITLVEKQPLGFDLLDAIYRFGEKPGVVYVHCKAGMCRGPTVAVVCLIACGLTVGEAMGVVSDAMIDQYKWHPLVPEFDRQVITEIYAWDKQRVR